MSESCATGIMANEDTSVCTPDPLPDAVASLLIPRGEIAPARALCELAGERDLFLSTFDEATDAMSPWVSDPEEKEEATPLVRGEGSPPSIATNAAFVPVPPLLEFSPNRAVPALPSVDIFPPCGMLRTTFLSYTFPAGVTCYSEEQVYG